MANTPTSTTLLSSLNEFTSLDSFLSDGVHLFSSSSERNLSSLHHFIDVAHDLSRNVHLYSAALLQNSKTISMLRQHSASLQTHHVISRGLREIVEVPTKRPAGLYGEDIPAQPEFLGEWFASRIAAWGRGAGMESFPPEDDRDGKRVIVLAGKILVLDVELKISPDAEILAVKTTFADLAEGSQTPEGSASLGEFLVHVMGAFLVEARKGENADAVAAAKLGRHVQDGLEYLTRLEQLALKEGTSGIRWFRDIDSLGSLFEAVALREANHIRSVAGRSTTPLDLLLQIGHGLALPYLTSPSLSFLVHLSPLAYLTLQRSSPLSESSKLPALDISHQHLRTILSSQSQLPGVYLATLTLLFSATTSQPPPHPLLLGTRPSFPFSMESGTESGIVNHNFLLPKSESGRGPEAVWCLDFTSNGRSSGIVMAQSRMREIELIINPLVESTHLPQGPTYGPRSWVDMIVNPEAVMPLASGRYTATYTSPQGIHPPLELKLGAVHEPGYLLERVHVYNVREVWGILEIVQEQCWLNEFLKSCSWAAEDSSKAYAFDASPVQVTDEELAAVLSGAIVPHKIPVNVYIPDAFHSSFESSLNPRSRAAIHLTSPERAIPGLVEIVVAHDASRPRGVSVEVRGAMGADLDIDVLEEATRRGGLFGLPGRVWARAPSAV